jgi:hypothetical protein
MPNEPATNVKRETYSGGELAALLELFLRNLNTNLEPFDSFQSQLEISELIGQSIDFHRAMTAIKELYRVKPHVVDGLHASVRAIVAELDGTGLWKSDKFVDPAHIRTLCSTSA